MIVYRTGNHWGVTIVAEQEGGCTGISRCVDMACAHTNGPELVAVVTNRDTGLAERICALLNAEHAYAKAFDEIDRLLDDYRGPKALREGVREAVFNARAATSNAVLEVGPDVPTRDAGALQPDAVMSTAPADGGRRASVTAFEVMVLAAIFGVPPVSLLDEQSCCDADRRLRLVRKAVTE